MIIKRIFDNINKCLKEIKVKNSNNIKLMIIGNKIDLKEFTEFLNEQAMNKAKELGKSLIKTSSLDVTNVKGTF